MVAPDPVEGAEFGGAFDATGGGLVDVDMGAWGALDVLVFGDVQCDSGEADCFAQEPAYILLGHVLMRDSKRKGRGG